ncbi:hypothetical protein [Bradyrhizobium arachidis]|jgi:hypothetical protein|uniref:hypothetical protein n=1 Tax=Bradyrhizobium arachidis TaxID=858423 RepID=UPI00216234CD|nr:hypothetical protein [Bradyrhizobium arachidis]UVO27181.1 hypothetical protein KUF59_32435 [Bradyrhizobium arachidis]
MLGTFVAALLPGAFLMAAGEVATTASPEATLEDPVASLAAMARIDQAAGRPCQGPPATMRRNASSAFDSAITILFRKMIAGDCFMLSPCKEAYQF